MITFLGNMSIREQEYHLKNRNIKKEKSSAKFMSEANLYDILDKCIVFIKMHILTKLYKDNMIITELCAPECQVHSSMAIFNRLG